ncbi:MAG: hypothetical protein AAFV07_10410 [Bacteroidota bacterium]
MRNVCAIFLLATLLLLGSCAQIYYHPDAKTKASKHQIVAIIPPKVSIAAKKKVDAEALVEQQRTDSYTFQQELYSWLLRRKAQNRIKVDLLDVETTNAKLKRAGYFDENPLTPSEAAALLGVDAVITSNFALARPMSELAAVAVGVLVGVWGPTRSTVVSLEIHDRTSQQMLWNYNHEISGSVGSTHAGLVNHLMRGASKRMPYEQRMH